MAPISGLFIFAEHSGNWITAHLYIYNHYIYIITLRTYETILNDNEIDFGSSPVCACEIASEVQ